ncbi:MAG: hypothetical protein ACYTAF_02915 [Planctomycetota bacterium]|jgi:hypothetical protein
MGTSTKIMYAVLGVFAILHVLTFLKLAEIRNGTQAETGPPSAQLPEKAYSDTSVLAVEVEKLRREVVYLRSAPPAPSEGGTAPAEEARRKTAPAAGPPGIRTVRHFPTWNPEVEAALSRFMVWDHFCEVLLKLEDACGTKFDEDAYFDLVFKEASSFAGVENRSREDFRDDVVRVLVEIDALQQECRQRVSGLKPKDPTRKEYRDQTKARIKEVLSGLRIWLERCPAPDDFLEWIGGGHLFFLVPEDD